MLEALRQSGFDREQVDFVSAHGTSSALGDRVEAAALRELFGSVRDRPWVNATKALTGHCVSAAGLIAAVAVVLQLAGAYVHGNPHLERPVDRTLAWVGPTWRAQSSRVALTNSFGFGGINSSQVFSAFEG